MTASLILMLLSSVSGLFTNLVGPQWEPVIQNGLGAISALIAGWVRGGTAADTTASLRALQTILAELQKDTHLDPQLLPQVEEAIKVTEAAIKGYEDAENGADPSDLPVPDPVQ